MAERTSSDIALDLLDATDADLEVLYPAGSELAHRRECLPPDATGHVHAARQEVARALAAVRAGGQP